MQDSMIEKTIDKLSGLFLNATILVVWALAVMFLTQMEFPAAFQIWPVVLLLGMIALSLPFALAILAKGGFTHAQRKSVF